MSLTADERYLPLNCSVLKTWEEVGGGVLSVIILTLYNHKVNVKSSELCTYNETSICNAFLARDFSSDAITFVHLKYIFFLLNVRNLSSWHYVLLKIL